MAGGFGAKETCQVLENHPERTLVLVGGRGNGKSATGNSILGKHMFQSRTSRTCITKKCELQESTLPNGLQVNVIDTPGLFSSFTSKEILRCLLLAKGGMDAVLLVFSVENPLTVEDRSTLRTLKILFGSQIVDYIIVVFTNEDVLEGGETLDDYLQDCPELQEILEECDDRKVLFDNRRNAPAGKKEKQVHDLLNLVEQISRNNNGNSYMADLSFEIRKNKATMEEKKKKLKKSYKTILKGTEGMVEMRLIEAASWLDEKRAEEENARLKDNKMLEGKLIKKINEVFKNFEAELKKKINKVFKILKAELEKKIKEVFKIFRAELKKKKINEISKNFEVELKKAIDEAFNIYEAESKKVIYEIRKNFKIEFIEKFSREIKNLDAKVNKRIIEEIKKLFGKLKEVHKKKLDEENKKLVEEITMVIVELYKRQN